MLDPGPVERFPPAFRLGNSAEFDAVFKNGDFRFSARHFLFLARSNEVGHPRLGMVVAKRSVQRAVQRNRVKRIIRESFRKHSGSLPPCDVVLLCRGGLAETDNRSIGIEVEGFWQRLRDSIS